MHPVAAAVPAQVTVLNIRGVGVDPEANKMIRSQRGHDIYVKVSIESEAGAISSKRTGDTRLCVYNHSPLRDPQRLLLQFLVRHSLLHWPDELFRSQRQEGHGAVRVWGW